VFFLLLLLFIRASHHALENVVKFNSSINAESNYIFSYDICFGRISRMDERLLGSDPKRSLSRRIWVETKKNIYPT
jgi:glycosyltransferase involved in cell wall biosynthesis